MPGESIGLPVPIEDVQDWRVGSFFQKFVSAVFLRGFQRLVGVDLEKSDIKYSGAAVGGAVAIGDSEGDIPTCPSVGPGVLLRWGGEAAASGERLAFASFGVSDELGLEAVGLSVAGPIAGGDVTLLKSASPCDGFWPLGLFRFRWLTGFRRARRHQGQSHKCNDLFSHRHSCRILFADCIAIVLELHRGFLFGSITAGTRNDNDRRQP